MDRYLFSQYSTPILLSTIPQPTRHNLPLRVDRYVHNEYGRQRYIDTESRLRFVNNPHDCLRGINISKHNKISNAKMTHMMITSQIFRNGSICDSKIWNKQTNKRN